MKKILLLLIAIILACPAAYAADEGLLLYINEDFESYEAAAEGEEIQRPAWVYNNAFEGFPIVTESETSTNKTKYMKFGTDVTGKREAVRIMFKDNAEVNKGKLCIEFDGYIDMGGLCVSLVDASGNTSWEKQCIMAVGTRYSSPAYGIKVYKTTASITPPGGGTLNSARLAAKTKTWQHYKLTLDFEASSVNIDIDGESVLESGYDYIGTDKDAIKGITMNVFLPNGTEKPSGFSFDVMLDNLKVYQEKAAVKNVYFVDYEGRQSTDMSGVSAMSKNVVFDLVNTVAQSEADKITAQLTNVTQNTTEAVTAQLSEDGSQIIVTPALGYLANNCDYTLTLPNTFTDKIGTSMDKPYILSFTTDNGGFRFSKAEYFKGDDRITDLSQISETDEVTAKLTYILTHKDYAKDNVIIAVAAEKGNRLTGFNHSVCAMNTLGVNTVEIKLNAGEELDKLTAYVWDGETRLPIGDEIIFPSEQ